MKIRSALLTVPALLLATSACAMVEPAGDNVATAGEGTASAAPRSSAPASMSPEDAQLKFAQCMRDNGVEVSDPGTAGGMGIDARNMPKDKLQKAMKACEKYIQVGNAKINPNDPKVADALLKFVSCMRKNGFDMPDPPTGMDMLTQPMPGDPDDPKFKKAMQACNQHLPGGGQG